MVQAGQTMTAQAVNDTYPWCIYKPNDQSLASSTTLQADTDLWCPVVARATYEVELYVAADSAVDAATAIDAVVDWSVPTGSVFTARYGQGPGSSMTSVASTGMTTLRSYWTDNVVYGTDDLPSAITERGILMTGDTPGILQLRWAQNTSSTNPLTFRAGSCLIVRRIALWQQPY